MKRKNFISQKVLTKLSPLKEKDNRKNNLPSPDTCFCSAEAEEGKEGERDRKKTSLHVSGMDTASRCSLMPSSPKMMPLVTNHRITIFAGHIS